MKIGSIFGLAAVALTLITGHSSAIQVGKVQPMKLASMEALYNGGTGQGLTVFAAVNPFKQPDYVNQQEPPMKMAVPNGLSFLATLDANGYVPGVNDLLNGYTKPDGTKVISVEEKMKRGQMAIAALQDYRSGKKDEATKQILKDNMPYFGYGYVKSPHQVVPFIPVNFWAFRVMVGIGMLLILFFICSLFIVYKKEIIKHRWLLISGIVLLPCAYLASQSGWLVAEFGRQPWTIQDMLPTWVAVSDIKPSSVIVTFFIFLILFTAMLAVEINILCKAIKKGPENSEMSNQVEL